VDANHLPDNDPRRAEGWRELGKALYGEKKTGGAEAIEKAAEIYDAAGPNSASSAVAMRKILIAMK